MLDQRANTQQRSRIKRIK